MLSATDTAALTNWCGSHTLAPRDRVVRPRDEADLQRILQNTDAQRIQVLGSRYSWPELITADDGVVIDTSAITGVTAISDASVEVLAGTPLHVVHAVLAGIGRRLAYSPPVITEQTVGGAIATGTHGQGLASSTIGDAALAMTLIDATGTRHRITATDPNFGAYQLNLGCLGVVTRVTLPTVTNQPLTCEKRAVPYRTFVTEFPGWQREYPYCKAWWFPDDDRAHVWLIRAATGPEARSFHDHGRVPVADGIPNHSLDAVVSRVTARLRADTRITDASASQFRTVRRFENFTNVTGYLDDLVCKGIPVPQINTEIGIPLDRFARAQDELDHWYRTSRPSMHYPFILRATGPSTAWLSPAHGRETCYYGMLAYQATDGTVSPTTYTALRQAQQILAGHAGLPHWGKHFNPNDYVFPTLPRWHDFHRLRRVLDPDTRLTNPYLNAIFGDASNTGTSPADR